jgi:hypothetical protein
VERSAAQFDEETRTGKKGLEALTAEGETVPAVLRLRSRTPGAAGAKEPLLGNEAATRKIHGGDLFNEPSGKKGRGIPRAIAPILSTITREISFSRALSLPREYCGIVFLEWILQSRYITLLSQRAILTIRPERVEL